MGVALRQEEQEVTTRITLTLEELEPVKKKGQPGVPLTDEQLKTLVADKVYKIVSQSSLDKLVQEAYVMVKALLEAKEPRPKWAKKIAFPVYPPKQGSIGLAQYEPEIQV